MFYSEHFACGGRTCVRGPNFTISRSRRVSNSKSAISRTHSAVMRRVGFDWMDFMLPGVYVYCWSRSPDDAQG